MKIAIFHLAFVYSGGGERLVLEEAIGLSKKGHDVTCFSPVVNHGCFPELMKKVKIRRLFPKLPSWFPDVELFSILASCILAPLMLFRFRNYDLYFGANQPGPWIAYVLSKINKKPYAVYLAQPTRLIHPRFIDQTTGLKITDGISALNILTKLFKPIISFLDVKSIKGTNLVFANGSYAKGLLDEVYRINAISCPGGTHQKDKTVLKLSARLKESIKINGLSIKKPYILVTNRHFSQKRFEYAIDAFLNLKDKSSTSFSRTIDSRKKNNDINPLNKLAGFEKVLDKYKELSLVITGEKTDYTKILEKKYKNKKNIHFAGFLSEEELNSAYRNALVYVYPAPEEDFGMGIIEAMSYGVPVVAWGNAGPSGIIEHGKDGLLAKPFSVEDYALNIEKLLKDKDLYKRISNSAFKKVKEKFSYKIHNEILENKIRLLVENS